MSLKQNTIWYRIFSSSLRLLLTRIYCMKNVHKLFTKNDVVLVHNKTNNFAYNVTNDRKSLKISENHRINCLRCIFNSEKKRHKEIINCTTTYRTVKDSKNCHTYVSIYKLNQRIKFPCIILCSNDLCRYSKDS